MIQPDTSDDVAPAEATTSSSRSYTQRAAKARSPTFAQFQQGLEDNARFSRLPLFFSVLLFAPITRGKFWIGKVSDWREFFGL